MTWFKLKERNFSLHFCVQTDSGSRPISCLIETGDSFYWANATGREAAHLSPPILYIKMNVCLFVCLFVPYPHFWTDRNQTLHTSPPWSGRDRRVCMGPQYFTSPTFSAYFVGSGCRLLRSRWLPERHYHATALYPWCGVCWCEVTHGGLCNKNAEKWTECVCVCVKVEIWWDGKEVTNELHLQLHCIYTNDNVKPI
jgi:hypothetical protein